MLAMYLRGAFLTEPAPYSSAKVARWFQGGWRLGMSQGFGGDYMTAGFTGRIAAFQLDLATYADEYGPGSVKKAPRKYMASIADIANFMHNESGDVGNAGHVLARSFFN